MLRRFSLLLAGTGVYALAQWMVVAMIARLSGVTEQGQYSYALALLAPWTMLARLNLRSVLITDYAREFPFPGYLATRLAGAIVPFAVLPAIILVAEPGGAVTTIAVAIVLMKAVEALGDICHGEMQWKGRYDRIATALVLRSVLMVLAFGASVAITGSVVLGVLATSLCWAYLFRWFELPVTGVQFTKGVVAGLASVSAIARKCWPLGVTMSLASFFNAIPVYVLARSTDIDSVGRYTAVAYLWTLGVLVATPMVQAVSIRMSRLFHEHRRLYILTLCGGIAAVLVGGLAIVVAARMIGEEVLVMLYGPEYSGLGALLVIMAYGLIVSVLLPLFGLNLTIARVFRLQLAMNIASIGAVWLLSEMLIPSSGLEGAAWAFVYASMFKLALSAALGLWVLMRASPSRSGVRHDHA